MSESNVVWSGQAFSDEELADLALQADPDEPLASDAVPIDLYRTSHAVALPEWYMAPVRARITGRLGRTVVLVTVTAFLLIEAFGLCSTYGQLPLH
ncbi:MAG: hypothetical protein ACYDD4_06970 [Acidimicrobiales bacterium]